MVCQQSTGTSPACSASHMPLPSTQGLCDLMKMTRDAPPRNASSAPVCRVPTLPCAFVRSSHERSNSSTCYLRFHQAKPYVYTVHNASEKKKSLLGRNTLWSLCTRSVTRFQQKPKGMFTFSTKKLILTDDQSRLVDETLYISQKTWQLLVVGLEPPRSVGPSGYCQQSSRGMPVVVLTPHVIRLQFLYLSSGCCVSVKKQLVNLRLAFRCVAPHALVCHGWCRRSGSALAVSVASNRGVVAEFPLPQVRTVYVIVAGVVLQA